MYISDFKYYKPKTIEEALTILDNSKDAAPLAGGTDMLVEIKQGLRHHADIISLSEIRELKTIEEENGNLCIGAAATHSKLVNSPLIQKRFPVIAEAASSIGTEQVRNAGTVGGNLCTGASCCDIAPILIALGATATITGSGGSRTVALKDFFINHKKTEIQKGELMTRLVVPNLKPGTGAAYNKFGLRESASISVASVAVMLEVKDDVCVDACVVIGAVAPIPMISNGATDLIKNAGIADLSEGSVLLGQAGDAAAADSVPIDDIRGTALYRKDLIKTLVQRTILQAIDRAKS